MSTAPTVTIADWDRAVARYDRAKARWLEAWRSPTTISLAEREAADRAVEEARAEIERLAAMLAE